MKTNIRIIYLVTLVSALCTTSCTKDFKELSVNPNAVEKPLPQALLAQSITDIVATNMNRSQRIQNELMQVTVNMGDGDGKIFRYDVRKAEADYLYRNWYLELTNLNDVYRGGVETASPTYQAIALICRSWVFSLLTDTYGDVPFTEANQGKDGLFTPKFDKQQDIYAGMFAQLEEANTLLKTGANVASSSDPLFGGNAAKWRKFGNSLYLRLLLRVSAKTELNTPAKITEMIDTNPANYPVMASNDDSAILKWTGVSPYVSPFATWRPADWYTPKLASFFVDNLNEWSDPRIGRWATLADGEYAGIPSGYQPGQAPPSKSTLLTSLQTEALLGNVMNYSELQFILAEAAAKGWTTKSAKTYYETGATNAISLWNLTVPTGYLGFQKVKWDDTYTLDQKMELIHKQKYYALFFTDLEQWFEYRRTGHPVLPTGPGFLNGGKMPARLSYPTYVQTSNTANYNAAVAAQGADDINTKVWWQK
ncbi:SusD/RagB family nutrient-binding outer membrane lipoprotein [Mucilaginibacter pallidiroseus]|uniref:SusD/RagB family nutrient-binding outer membrane lipoprotein n=1 Tax=Mucilaginibacter pallidiroseus TaxID=2599295 RepID=A0A563UG64_9SPHI|nr:SusD/RagB family nutrient-binding outer membrane lipoprotein [Mucilaginibacter pallidiroseus]TWR30269.1 SusD/RagB family nutrient-binding outer membrane lipoprotein [Mucilaginibacter pallidiroseus]